MDEEHCVIAIQTSEVAKFNMTADKRRYNVFLICPAAPAGLARPLSPVALDEAPAIWKRRCKGTNIFETGKKSFFFFISSLLTPYQLPPRWELIG